MNDKLREQLARRGFTVEDHGDRRGPSMCSVRRMALSAPRSPRGAGTWCISPPAA